MATYPLVNGRTYSHAEVRIKCNGRLFRGVKEISYNDKLESTKLRGTSPQPLARTLGDYDAEGSITMYRQDADELIAFLGDGFYTVEFQIQVAFGGKGVPLTVDVLEGVRIKTKDQTSSQGADPTEVKFDLDLMLIRHNGVLPLPADVILLG